MGTTKRLFAQKLGSEVEAVRRADATVDELLEALQNEEPELYAWILKDPDLARVFSVSLVAVKQDIERYTRRDIGPGLSKVAIVMSRMATAAALLAVRRERAAITFRELPDGTYQLG